MRLAAWFAHDPDRPVLFCSGTFFFLFTVFVILWSLLRDRRTARLAWLLAFSYYYYYLCNGVFALVLVVLTGLDWLIALAVDRLEHPAARKAGVAVGIGVNLGALAFFKYADFALRGVSAATGAHVEPLHLFLPIGISFHVFQSISYLVDVYRRTQAPTRSLFEYALFLSFFPQVVAGPIVRAREFFPQLSKRLRIDSDDVTAGLFRVLLGIAKKALLADFLGIYVDLVFNAPAAYSGPEVLLGIYAYALQIYLDFSGYSDMAIGLARMLGLRLPENFDAPYRATSITDFWRRWHMSLSRWLRDYVYIPLGGNRRGNARRLANLLLTMLLGGLWHGASWSFVAWGGLHGLALAAERWRGERRRASESPWRAALGWLLTFHTVALLWVLFRTEGFGEAWGVLRRLVVGWELGRLGAIVGVRAALIGVLAVGLTSSLLPLGWWTRMETRFQRTRWPVRAAAVIVLIQAVVQVSTANVRPFIYFQF